MTKRAFDSEKIRSDYEQVKNLCLQKRFDEAQKLEYELYRECVNAGTSLGAILRASV